VDHVIIKFEVGVIQSSSKSRATCTLQTSLDLFNVQDIQKHIVLSHYPNMPRFPSDTIKVYLPATSVIVGKPSQAAVALPFHWQRKEESAQSDHAIISGSVDREFDDHAPFSMADGRVGMAMIATTCKQAPRIPINQRIPKNASALVVLRKWSIHSCDDSAPTDGDRRSVDWRLLV